MSDDTVVYKSGPMVQVTRSMLDEAQAWRENVVEPLTRMLASEINESLLDATDGPRFGPRRVLNDAQQATDDRRQALAEIVLDLADEWGVYDLVRGDEW